MTAPYARCAKCDRDLYPRLARRTEEGWACADHFCRDCHEVLGAKNTSGYCRRCYDRRRKAEQLPVTPKPAKRPCARCGITARSDSGICADCSDVLGAEVARWVA